MPQKSGDKRLQLNIRIDGREDLLEAIRANAESQGLSVNAWLVKTLESVVGIESDAPVNEEIESAVASVLDKLLADKLTSIKAALRDEILGESVA
ncbi:toxin-antitoxin system HicB family antitoxin [Microcoleus sp. BR0-C5]|uniref:toxin-antitoxin system HicB family antitoxin n=1 Tax=Microcoleus sp. BR0-C5 TaxID=2818713 RepID=UPI002FD234D4